jgi:hypothetical protein
MSPVTHPPVAASPAASRESGAAPAGGFSGMVWLTWRQHRWALLGSLVLATVLIGGMALLAAELTTLHHQCHSLPCPQYSPQALRLSAPFGPGQLTNYLLLLVKNMPLLIGVFLGVPLLAREHEQRTLLLAWSQDVSPARWLWTKLALLGLFVATLTAAISAVSDHLAHVQSTVSIGSLFEARSLFVTGLLPVATSVCWFAVGVALGAVIRRTLPAVFAVIAGFIGVTLGVEWRYPTLIKPLFLNMHLDQPPTGVLQNNALIVNGRIAIGSGLRSNLFDSSGHELDFATLHRLCPDIGADPGATVACFTQNHLQTHYLYQPGSRIPLFHLILAAGYLGLAAVALGTVWLIVRRTNLSAG